MGLCRRTIKGEAAPKLRGVILFAGTARPSGKGGCSAASPSMETAELQGPAICSAFTARARKV